MRNGIKTLSSTTVLPQNEERLHWPKQLGDKRNAHPNFFHRKNVPGGINNGPIQAGYVLYVKMSLIWLIVAQQWQLLSCKRQPSYCLKVGRLGLPNFKSYLTQFL